MSACTFSETGKKSCQKSFFMRRLPILKNCTIILRITIQSCFLCSICKKLLQTKIMLELVCIVSCVCMYLNMWELVLQLSVVHGRTYPYMYTRYCCDVMWFYVLTCVTILRVTIMCCHVFTCQYIFHTSMCTFLSCDPTHNCCHLLLKRCVKSGCCINKYHYLFLSRPSEFCSTVGVLKQTKSN